MIGGRRVERMARGARRGRVEVAVLAVLVGVLGAAVAVSFRPAVAEPGAGRTGAPALVAAAPGLDVTAAVTTPFGDGGRWSALPVLDAGAPADVSVRVVPPATVRTWQGVGAALSDASVALLTDHADARALLFDPAVQGGAALDVVRLPLSATDFSLRPWTWAASTTTFEPAPEAIAAVDVLERIVAVRPDLAVIGAAWTAPPDMRTNPDAPGGRLVDTARYATLLAAQVEWLVGRGVPLTAVSLGNEPGHVGDAPSLGMTDDQMVALSETVHARFAGLGVDLVALDHNWSDAPRAARLVERGTFDAVGFHCYDGDADAMAGFDVPVLVTECTATTGGWHSSVGWMARELVGDSIRAGSTGLLMWNLALDPAHGPKRPGGCHDCRGLVTIDPTTGTVTATPELDVLVHLSAASDPGATVLDVDHVTDVPLAAFANPDGTVGVFGHNDTPEPLSIAIRIGDADVRLDVPSWGIFSLRTGDAVLHRG